MIIPYQLFIFKSLKQVMGIEPTYSAWKADVLPLNHTCIAAVKTAQNIVTSRCEATTAQSRNRTSDTGIFSPLLYQLSYLGERPCVTVSHNARLIISLIEVYFKCFYHFFYIFSQKLWSIQIHPQYFVYSCLHQKILA